MPESQYSFSHIKNVSDYINEYISSKNDNSNLVLLKHPSDVYSQSNAISLKILLDRGFKGIFISFQRPRKNLDYWIRKNSLDIEKIVILDYSDTKHSNIADLYDDIIQSIKKIDGGKKFVFIDSLNTMSLCNQGIWIDDFTGRLLENIGNNTFENTIFIVNVAKELFNKNIVHSFVEYADGVIDILNNKGKYSQDLTKNSIFN